MSIDQPSYHPFANDFTECQWAAEEITAHARRLELVLTVTREISHELDLSKLLQRITQLTAALTGSTTCVIFLWDEGTQLLIPRSWYGAGEWFGELRLG